MSATGISGNGGGGNSHQAKTSMAASIIIMAWHIAASAWHQHGDGEGAAGVSSANGGMKAAAANQRRNNENRKIAWRHGINGVAISAAKSMGA
jgi:hypothetical protein